MAAGYGKPETSSGFAALVLGNHRPVIFLHAYSFRFLRTDSLVLVLPHTAILIMSMFIRAITINDATRDFFPASAWTYEMPFSGVVDLAAYQDITGRCTYCTGFTIVLFCGVFLFHC